MKIEFDDGAVEALRKALKLDADDELTGEDIMKFLRATLVKTATLSLQIKHYDAESKPDNADVLIKNAEDQAHEAKPGNAW